MLPMKTFLRSRIRPVSLRLTQLLSLFLLAYPVLSINPLQAEGIDVPNPGTELWREVRQRGELNTPPVAPGVDLWREVQVHSATPPVAGTTQVTGMDSGQLINLFGDQWRKFRMEKLLPYGGYVLGGMVVFIGFFYFTRGRVPIQSGLSDKVLFRYSVYERMVHWFIASLFIFQAITGFLLLFGRTLVIPLIGKEAFSVLATASKEGHNLFGPLFLLALALIFVQFVRRNIYQKGDLTWLLRGGGIIGKKHVPSNFFNMGEKSMFWLLVLVGGAIGLSGLLLIFPMLGEMRAVVELSHAAHGIAAVLMTAVLIGHAYIGSIGMEGALESMKTGYCDLHWAREHHDWWAQRCEKEGKVYSRDEVGPVAGSGAPEPAVVPAVEERVNDR